jgi:diguanylate cyclase (GGDEF)-like protein
VEITERKQAELRIQDLAYSDQLTGLANRARLADRIEQVVTSSERSGKHAALMLMDLDKFKAINDVYGHDAGDRLLQQVAERLLCSVRAEDTVARIGGDEFVVLLSNLAHNAADAANQIEHVGLKILENLSPPYMMNGVPCETPPSIGASLFIGKDVDVEAVMKQADLAMYRAKQSGGNALRFFDPVMEEAVLHHSQVERELRAGVESSQFVIYLQPQVRGETIVGAEALMRWQHPTRGIVSPVDFISLAEETGLILPLGRQVLRIACAQLAAWQKHPKFSNLSIAVNVSVRQIAQEDFVSQVLEVVEEFDVIPRLLKLEITESVLASDIEDVIVKMTALKVVGVEFSLDDFGTGYSSLSYLRRLPLTQLKLDRSFVVHAHSDNHDAAITRTVISLGKSLGMNVIAEGVESQAQRDFLFEAGCETYQGYFFSRPLPIDEFERKFG